MAKRKTTVRRKRGRRQYSQEFKEEAVQMKLHGHSPASVAQRLGPSSTNVLYRWKQQTLLESGPVAGALLQRVRDLEDELRRTPRERDMLKKALAIFGRNE